MHLDLYIIKHSLVHILTLHARHEGFHDGVGEFLHAQTPIHDDANRAWIRGVAERPLDGTRIGRFDGRHGERIEISTQGVDLDETVLDANTRSGQVVSVTQGREQDARGLFLDGCTGTDDIAPEGHGGRHGGALRWRRR